MFHKTMPIKFNSLILSALLLMLPVQVIKAEMIKLPIKIDFPLVHQLMLSQLFKGKLASTEILNDPSGCSEIILSDSKLSELNSHLQINSRLNAKLAVKMLDRCVPLLSWEGYAQITSKPIIKKDNPRLIYLQVINSQLINKDNEILTEGVLWEQAKKQLHPLFEQFHLDLTPSINELNSFLPLILPKHSQTQMSDILNSLHLNNIQIANDGILTDLAFELNTIPQIKQAEQPLTDLELNQWQEQWQSMDALLTHTIKYYAAATELEDLKLTLLDILIGARYELVTALQQQQSKDPVRHWFISSWSKLIPVIKQITSEKPEHATLALLTLMTASDALQALDKVGPSLGLDISIDGLRRLARMLNQTPNIDPLNYDEALDPDLLNLFQFNFKTEPQSQSILNLWPISSAIAANDRPLDQWLSSNQNLDSYLLKVRKLLLTASRKAVMHSKLTAQQKDVFKKMLLTTAWQESCWRQYVVKQNKIVPLRSSTGDTGIMQINEKVWRGFVDPNKLRWDIHYNIETGSNILLNYMTRYAIKNAEHKQPGGIDNLARATYSAYNGGPGQISRYRNSKTFKEYKKIDRAFYTKYQKVKQGNELAVAECLGETKANKTLLPTKKLPVAKTAKKNLQALSGVRKKLIQNEKWIKQQPANYYTLQMGSFSSQPAAIHFIKQQTITGNYAIYQQTINKQSHHTVIYGHYSTRSRAENETALFISVKPWLRPFKAIQEIIKN